ncbi:MAG: hypothetical protein HY077_16160 [Elusimicrobia bacterium]|nr:hypothetical protein [Elusimicrobiota bacterium]
MSKKLMLLAAMICGLSLSAVAQTPAPAAGDKPAAAKSEKKADKKGKKAAKKAGKAKKEAKAEKKADAAAPAATK